MNTRDICKLCHSAWPATPEELRCTCGERCGGTGCLGLPPEEYDQRQFAKFLDGLCPEYRFWSHPFLTRGGPG